VSWRVFATDYLQSDLDALSEDDRVSLHDELFSWVETGPPMVNRRNVAGAELFEDHLPSGFLITYFVELNEPYVAILRVRKIEAP
jgi:hypothetical protein